MDKKSIPFSAEYAVQSSTDVPGKPSEEEKKDQTIAGKIGQDDKSKPYRVIIRAREIKE